MFLNSVPKVYIARAIDVLCSNFVKFGRREIAEIGEIVRCLPDKKQISSLRLSSCRYCADHAQNLPRPAPDNVVRMLQISSKSIHFRWSYR